MMKLIMPIGIEGTGHALLRAVLRPAFAQPLWIDQAEPLYSLLKNKHLVASRESPPWRYRVKTALMGSNSNRLGPPIEVVRRYVAEGTTYYISPSYPFGHVARAYRMPSVPGIVSILRELSGSQVDLKFIFLRRDVRDCTYSCVRRGHNADPWGASHEMHLGALCVEDALRYLIREGIGYFPLDYESAVKDPHGQTSKLASFLGINSDLVNPMAILPPTGERISSPAIDEYFANRSYQFH